MSSRPTLRRVAAASAVLAAVLVPSASASAADGDCTRYAARDGSDANAGTLAAPKLTVPGLVASLREGETGCLRGGTYTETSNGYIARIATPGVALRSAPGERARIAGIVYVVSSAAGAHLSDLDIEGTGGSNTVKVYAPDVVIERNTITNAHRGQSCVMLGSNSGAGQATRVVLRRNVLSACGNPLNGNKDHAIYASNVDGGEIVENVISDPTAYAIQLYPNAQRTRFAHNVVDGGQSIRGGVLFGGDTSFASVGNVVERNVLTHAATNALTASWGGTIGTGNVARDNCVFGAAQGAVGTLAGWVNQGVVTADPGFVDRAAGDYRLALDSPCLAVVGHDTARAMAGEPAQAPAPLPTATPTATPSATPTATPSATPTPGPTVEPEPTTAPEAPAPSEPAPAPAPTTEEQPTTVNAPPSVRLTSPAANLTARAPLTMSADAQDDRAVAKVDFYVDGRLVATDDAAPFTVSVDLKHDRKTHKANARAHDAGGLSSLSPAVSFRIG